MRTEIELTDVYYEKFAALFLFKLLAERLPEESISHKSMPSYTAHAQFVLSRPYLAWYLIKTTTAPKDWVGAVYITRANELGISIAADYRRKGYARVALQEIMRRHKPEPGVSSEPAKPFLANINPRNEASIKLFTGLGAVHIQNTYAFEEGITWETVQK